MNVSLAEPSALDQFTPPSEMPLDPGIKRYVQILRAGGIETFESCQGGLGHACAEPTVKFLGDNGEGFKALAIAKSHDLPVTAIRIAWDINEGLPHGPWWEMTFQPVEEAAPIPHS